MRNLYHLHLRMEMVSFSDEALEAFSLERMETSSIRSMGGVVHWHTPPPTPTGMEVDFNF